MNLPNTFGIAQFVKGLVPLIPVTLLLLAYEGWKPLAWLLSVPLGARWVSLSGALPVVRAMLIGTFVAASVSWKEIQIVGLSLFQGMGAAYGNIISLTISAQCFGAGIEELGLAKSMQTFFTGSQGALALLAILFSGGLALLTGSGAGAVQVFANAFLPEFHFQPLGPTLGAISCLAAAYGRTMSPVSAVVIYGAGLVGITPLSLIFHLLPPLLFGGLISFAVALLF